MTGVDWLAVAVTIDAAATTLLGWITYRDKR